MIAATYVSQGEEGAVKEEHDAEHHEERAERSQPDADFWKLLIGQWGLLSVGEEKVELCMSVSHIFFEG